MKPFIFILFLVLLCLASSCEKKKPPPTPLEQLPPETQEGKNTFGCLMDGEVWIPGGNPTGSFGAELNKDDLSIFAFKKIGTQYQSLTCAHLNVYGAGKYYFKYRFAGPPGAIYDVRDKNGKSKCYYQAQDSDSLNNYVIITKLDYQNTIISGTFNFKLYSDSCGYVNFTNGRFDLKFQQ